MLWPPMGVAVVCRALSGLLAAKVAVAAGEDPELPVLLAIGSRFVSYQRQLHLALPLLTVSTEYEARTGKDFGPNKDEVRRG